MKNLKFLPVALAAALASCLAVVSCGGDDPEPEPPVPLTLVTDPASLNGAWESWNRDTMYALYMEDGYYNLGVKYSIKDAAEWVSIYERGEYAFLNGNLLFTMTRDHLVENGVEWKESAQILHLKGLPRNLYKLQSINAYFRDNNPRRLRLDGFGDFEYKGLIPSNVDVRWRSPRP